MNIIKLPDIVIPKNTTVEALIEAGEYGECSPLIKDQISRVEYTGPRPLFLGEFTKENSNAHAIMRQIQSLKFSLAPHTDLLAVGATPRYRELQRKFPITSLFPGLQSNANSVVPCLGFESGERVLRVEFMRTNRSWQRPYHILLVGAN